MKSIETINGILLRKIKLHAIFITTNREWANLDDQQKKYLIQVRPPGDVMPDAIRDMIMQLNITNAAILFDESFGKKSVHYILYYSIKNSKTINVS